MFKKRLSMINIFIRTYYKKGVIKCEYIVRKYISLLFYLLLVNNMNCIMLDLKGNVVGINLKNYKEFVHKLLEFYFKVIIYKKIKECLNKKKILHNIKVI
jgi:hypothetical protein